MASKKARALGINHIVLEVDDLGEALQFYGSIFDFKLRGRNEHNAFIDLGDQFIQLRVGRTQEPDTARHFGFVVDDRELVKKVLEKMGVNLLERGLNFIDPWGNRVEVVAYSEIQFTKAENILRGMGSPVLKKTSTAISELSKKGMGPKSENIF